MDLELIHRRALELRPELDPFDSTVIRFPGSPKVVMVCDKKDGAFAGDFDSHEHLWWEGEVEVVLLRWKR